MKNNKKHSGFTLVEVLVVMAIIAALSTLGVAGFRGAQKTALKNQTRQVITTLNNGVERYITEFGSFPPPVEKSDSAWASSSELDLGTNGVDANTFLQELTGQAATVNYKGINFIEIEQSINGSSGLVFDTATDAPTHIIEPYKNSVGDQKYYITFDDDYDGEITIPAGYFNEGEQIRAKVLIYNAGFDGTPGTPDDVVSW